MECPKQAKQQAYSDALRQKRSQNHPEKTESSEEDPEEFKAIRWGSKTYMVSNFGRVKRMPCDFRRKEIFLKPSIGRYYRVTFDSIGKRKSFSVHRLVAQLFIQNPDGKPCVNHKDGDCYNNYFRNLEWVTHLENLMHSIDVLKRHRNTEKQRSSAAIVGKKKRIISMDDANKIRSMYQPKKITQKFLGHQFGISMSSIGRIVSGRSYID